DYMKKSKKTEASLQLNKLGKNAKVEFSTASAYPQGVSGLLPGTLGGACSSATKKMPVVSWNSDPVWNALSFQIDEPALFSYIYGSFTNSSAVALAIGDLDCDTTYITYQMDFSANNGNARVQLTEPSASAD
ncbi:MAG: hypothetical protein AB7O24_32310, partial [Kofleriaceae bacterium]